MVDRNISPEITVRDIWDSLNSVGQSVNNTNRTVSNIEIKMDALVNTSSDHELRLRTVEQLFAILNDVPERLVKVEHRIWSIPSVVSVLSLISLGVTLYNTTKK